MQNASVLDPALQLGASSAAFDGSVMNQMVVGDVSDPNQYNNQGVFMGANTPGRM